MTTKASTHPAMPAEQFELVAKALADPRRMAILEAVGSQSEFPCQRLCSAFPVSKGTISHHMKELVRAGLISARREGQFTHYEVNPEVLMAYSAELMRRVNGGG